MKNFKINFINHASLFIETEFYNILTDPWFISNAFGKWYHYPSPNYDDINKIIKAANKTYTLISHGHDDHLDDYFVKNYLNESQILISKFQSAGLFNRVKKISNKLPIQIEQNFSKPLKIKNNLFYSYSNKGMSNDSIIVIASDDEVIIHANDNYREQPREIINQIKKISRNKKVYYFSQVGIASSFPAIFKNLTLKKRERVIRSEHIRFLRDFEKNIDLIKPDFAFIYANQYKFDNEENLSYYDDVQKLIKNHSFIKQLTPGDKIVNGKFIKNEVRKDNLFDTLLKKLEILNNNYISSKINTDLKISFLITDENKNIKPKKNVIYFLASKSVWSSIISGQINMETILIGGNGTIIKIHSQNMREVSICISEFSYIYQNKISKNLFN